jgi:tetratricopeptide (TPR) repeat protein
LISFLGFQTTFAQNNIQKASQLAFKYFRDKEYKPASVLFHDLYDATKSKTYFDYYIQCLIRINKIKDAEKFIRKQIKRNPYDKTLLITLGYVYKESGRLEKANEHFQKVISKIAPVSNDINNVANAFIGKREYDFAIKAYQKGRQLLKRPHAFHFEIANVYLFSRDFENMIKEYLIALEVDQSLSNRVQNRFQSARFQDIDSSIDPILKKQLLAKSQKFPQNIAYQELLQWYFTQKKQFAAALIQAKSIDLLKKEDGFRLLALAQTAASNKAYVTAIKAYQQIIDKGGNNPKILFAQKGILHANYTQLIDEKIENENTWKELIKKYDQFFDTYKDQRKNISAIIEYAHIKAFYLKQSTEAIELLEEVNIVKDISKLDLARLKVKLADIQLFANEKWDAVLTYSQVEKTNKNNPIGYEAKFKKAKVSYYMGEFKWAKAQLDALKGSTSKLIANDAIALSQFISDNTSLDTSYTAMSVFADADFLIYQKKEKQALIQFDSLIQNYPSHTLIDDALLKKYEIYSHQNKTDLALETLNQITENHPWETITDKAFFLRAKLYEKQNQNQKAKEDYKKIITDYPSSIFSVEARERLDKLRK